MISHLVCRVMGHSINRRRVRFADGYFRTSCNRCHKPLVREQDGWEVAAERHDQHSEAG